MAAVGGGSIVAPPPTTPTCHQKVYDFFVVSNQIMQNVVGVRAILDGGWVPHAPVRLVLKGRPSTAVVRTLRAPKSLPAVLPHGPMNRSAAEMDVVLDSHCVHTSGMRVMKAVEDSLYQLIGHRPKSDEASRVDGPQIVQKEVSQQAIDPMGKAGPLVKSWQILITCLRTLLVSPVEGRRMAALWRLLYADVSLYAIKGVRLADGVRVCIAWRARLSRQFLLNRDWAKQMYKEAYARMEVEARFAADLACKDFQSWISEGPSKGLKRQHMMPRTAVGWIPSKVEPPSVHETQDPEGTDGLTAEELASVQVDVGSPQPL